MNKMSKNKEIETIFKNQAEILELNITTEMNTSTESFNSTPEETSNELKHRPFKII